VVNKAVKKNAVNNTVRLEQGAWWQVDLGSKKNINQIIIYNRTDCCVDRLSNYQVSVSNTADFSTHVYRKDFHITPNPKKIIKLDALGKRGRYVRIQLLDKNYLSLVEVQVMGDNSSHTISFNGLTYKTLISPHTGRVWLDRNLGATQVATKSTDTAAYGYYYQWGRNDDGHEVRSSGVSHTLASNVIDAGTDLFIISNSDWMGANLDSNGSVRVDDWKDGGANDICPIGFTVPTEKELMADTTDADVISTATAFTSFLKIPTAGSRIELNGTLIPTHRTNTTAILWSRTTGRMYSHSFSRSLYIVGDETHYNSVPRAKGASVRCIETQASPDPQDKGTDTISFNGLTYKEITSPDTGKVWLDRNLGATQACASKTDSACYGFLYQWGRDDDGHQVRTSGTTATKPAGITAVDGNYITHDTSEPYDWTDGDASGALRTVAWKDGGSNDICPAGFSVPTEAELAADTTTNTTAIYNFLKIPQAGNRSRYNGALNSVGESTFLWSRSAGGGSSVNRLYGRVLNITNSTVAFYYGSRIQGFGVRCIKD
jgi:hypothetical protein